MYEDGVIGAREEIGSHFFSEEEIIRFARQFDPQPFHLDAAEGAKTHFGGLVASGWHTGSAYIKVLVAYRKREAEARAAAGLPPRAMGPSPGFSNLKWIKPVRPGDTITYFQVLTAKRKLASRPGWGMWFSQNTGVNQHGEVVFEFDGKVLVPGA